MKKEKLEELKERIENASSWNYNEYYTELYNIATDCMIDTQECDFEYLLQDIIDYDLAEEYARQELDNGGLIRLYYFLGDANLNNDIFKIDGYGNLQDVDKDDLDYIKNEILDTINAMLKDCEEN